MNARSCVLVYYNTKVSYEVISYKYNYIFYCYLFFMIVMFFFNFQLIINLVVNVINCEVLPHDFE